LPIFRADDLKLEYTDTGAGVPLLLIPGVLGLKECFGYQVSALSDRCRVIAFTPALRRKGRAVDLDHVSSQALRLLKHLGVPSAVIVGHGAGGLAAIKLASAHPDCCLGLILHSCAPSFVELEKNRLIHDMLPGRPRFDSFLVRWLGKLGVGGRQVASSQTEQTPTDAGWDLSDSLVNNPHLSSRSIKAWMRVLGSADVTEDCQNVGVPALVVCGSDEPDYILAGSEALHGLIEGSILEVIEGVGEFAFYHRYDLFNQLVEEFLADRVPCL